MNKLSHQTMVINIQEFITDIHEARMNPMLRIKKIPAYTDCCERTYLTLLVLLLLNQYSAYRQYASYSETLKEQTTTTLECTARILHNFVYFVQGDDTAMDNPKIPKGAKILRKRTSFPLMDPNRYPMELQSGLVTGSHSSSFFFLLLKAD